LFNDIEHSFDMPTASRALQVAHFPLSIAFTVAVMAALRMEPSSALGERIGWAVLMFGRLGFVFFTVALVYAYCAPSPLLLLRRKDLEYLGSVPFRINKRDIERFEDIPEENAIRVHFARNGGRASHLIPMNGLSVSRDKLRDILSDWAIQED
jgi:hypothetical protein